MYTKNQAVLTWIDKMAALTKPDSIVWIDGSEEQLESLRQEAYKTGELIKLNGEELPGCVYHRSALNDVARVEDRTFICCEKKEDAGPTNNWMDPKEMHKMLDGIYDGAMKGRTMYVIPYSMSIVGSPFAKYGIELTDSIYVVVSMAIMTRVGLDVYDALGDSPDFIKGLHAKADLDAEKRYIVHFPQENTIMSVNSGYGGNVLLARSASPSASPPALAVTRAGWPSTCSSWALSSPTARSTTSPPPSPPPAARQTSPCSSPPRAIRRRATRSGPSATTSPGYVPAPTAVCGP